MENETLQAVRAVIEFVKGIDPLTVGELKKALQGLDDSLQIVIGAPREETSHDWTLSDWWNVSKEIEIPSTDFENGFSAVTLFLSDNFDNRQF
jgi:hypothetical protein